MMVANIIRAFICVPKDLKYPEVINAVVIFGIDALIYKYWGSGALLYLLISGYLSIGPHPLAMRVIAEHYEFVSGQETYDYLGICNIFNLNVGYHI